MITQTLPKGIKLQLRDDDGSYQYYSIFAYQKRFDGCDYIICERAIGTISISENSLTAYRSNYHEGQEFISLGDALKYLAHHRDTSLEKIASLYDEYQELLAAYKRGEDKINEYPKLIKSSPHYNFSIIQLSSSLAICEAYKDIHQWGNEWEDLPAFIAYVGCNSEEVWGIVRTLKRFYRVSEDDIEIRKPKYLNNSEREIKVRGLQRKTDSEAWGLDSLMMSNSDDYQKIYQRYIDSQNNLNYRQPKIA